MMTDRGGLGPALAVALSAIMWGLWWIPLRALEASGLTGDWTSVLLYGGAALVMLPAVALRRRGSWARWPLLLGIGLLGGVASTAWNHALITGDVVRVSLLFYLMPIWATGFGMLFLGETLRPLRGVSVLLGLAGAAVVLGFDGGVPLPRNGGEWMGLASGVLFALATTLVRRFGEPGGFEKTLATFIFAALSALPLALMQPETAPDGAVMIAGLPFLGICILWIIPLTWSLLWGAGRLDPGRVSILLLLEIVAAAISAATLTDEPFGWRELVGCVLILGAGLVEALEQSWRTPAKRSSGIPS